jgi:VanZ family protein
MHKIILLVRQLRGVPFFKLGTRVLVVSLMIVGAWVATRTFDFPETISLNDKVKHFVVFFGFSVLMDLAISRHPFWLWKGLPLLIYGAIIEIMQYFSPDRSFSLLDWLADFSGILLYFMIKVVFIWLDSRRLLNS